MRTVYHAAFFCYHSGMNPQLAASIENITTTRREIFMHIIIIFILPITLIYFKIIPITLRVPLLVVLVSALIIRVVREKWTPNMFGATFNKIRDYALPYAIFTAIGVFAIIQLSQEIPTLKKATDLWHHSHFLYAFFVVSFFQEVAYRGYLIPALGKLTRVPIYIVFANTLLFTYLHFIFPNPLLSLPVAFFGGLGFSIMYIRYPSLPLIIVAHSVLNFFAVWYGFFVVPGLTH